MELAVEIERHTQPPYIVDADKYEFTVCPVCKGSVPVSKETLERTKARNAPFRVQCPSRSCRTWLQGKA